MRRRQFITFLGLTAAAWPLSARAQQSSQGRLIGALFPVAEGDPAGESRVAALRRGLEHLGWTQSSLRIEVRWGSDPALAERNTAELAPLGAEVLLWEGTTALEALRRQTKTVPIVFVGVVDPVGQGFVASLAHPGGNITGFSVFDAPIAGKWLEMLAQITPQVARVAVLFNPTTAPFAGRMLQVCEDAAHSLALMVRAAPVNNESEIETVMSAIGREERSGVLVLPSTFTVAHRDAIVASAALHRVPAIYGLSAFAATGGLISYGSFDITDILGRAADYVDRILKGATPSNLPVQQPTKFELVINVKTAKALGVTIPPTLLATADEVIE